MATLYPIATIARLFNLTERRVQQLARDGIIPKAQRGKYDLVACVRGYVAYLQQAANGRTGDAAADRNRLVKAQADKAELECRMLMREVIPVVEVEEQWTRLLKGFQARLLALPIRIVQQVQASGNIHDAEQQVRRMIEALLSELADYDPERDDSDLDEEGAQGGGSAAKPHHQPVGRSIPEAE